MSVNVPLVEKIIVQCRSQLPPAQLPPVAHLKKVSTVSPDVWLAVFWLLHFPVMPSSGYCIFWLCRLPVLVFLGYNIFRLLRFPVYHY
jgi:hypothetical protein